MVKMSRKKYDNSQKNAAHPCVLTVFLNSKISVFRVLIALKGNLKPTLGT
jgi:hypothetical protein